MKQMDADKLQPLHSEALEASAEARLGDLIARAACDIRRAWITLPVRAEDSVTITIAASTMAV